MEILVISNYKTKANIDLSYRRLLEREMERAEIEAGKLLHNKNLQKQIVIVLGMTLWIISTHDVFAFAAGSAGIPELGARFWGLVKIFARWSCLIMCGLDVARNLNNGDTKSISKIVIKYILAYAVIVTLPWIFDQVDASIV